MLKIAALVFLLTLVAGFIPQAMADASRNPSAISLRLDVTVTQAGVQLC